MRFALCDDEKENIEKLKAILLKYKENKRLSFAIDTFQSGQELLEKSNKYDLIFLDIDMPELNGIETGKKISESDIDVKIVYVTNHEAYMKDAFTVRPFGYVLKPITEEKIISELDEFFRREEMKIKPNKVMFSGIDGDVLLNVNEISCFEIIGKNLLKATTNKEPIYVISSLNDAFVKLKSYNFAIPHQSFMVNLIYVHSFESNGVVMENGSKIPIAQKKLSTFKKEFFEYLHNDAR